MNITDRIYGVIFGQAIGDALGLGTEFLSKKQVREYYPDGLHHYEQIVQDWHRQQWTPGSWTDDTDQMLCIMDSLLEHRQVKSADIAKRLHHWAAHGGKGIGSTVFSVLFDPEFVDAPQKVAQKIWELTGKEVAANGGVMRTSILGVWDYRNRHHVIRNAETVCRITHYDPRCVGSCVGICLVIRDLLMGEKDLDKVLHLAFQEISSYDRRFQEYIDVIQDGTLEDLDLDEGLTPGEQNTIGYTLKTFAAGLWTLKHATSFEHGLLTVIHEGGDADTNGAVTGALLGARFGLSDIPEKWVNNLVQKDVLQKRLQQFEALLVPSNE